MSDPITVTEQRITVTVVAGDEVTVTETPVAVTVGGADHPSTHPLAGADHTGVISSAQHGVFASGDHHTEYGRKAAAEAISGAWTFSALLTASAHIQMGAAGEIRDSGGVARIKVATATPHVLLGSSAVDGGGRVRINDSLGIHSIAPTSEYLRIDAGSAQSVMALRGTKTGGVGLGVSLVNFQTVYDLAGVSNAFFEGFNVPLSVTDPSTGGSIGDVAAFKVASNIQDGATVTRLAFFRFPHPPGQNGVVANFSIFDVGDVDDPGLNISNGSVLRIGDRGGGDVSPWGVGCMGLFGYARPISQEWTSAAMVGIAGGGSFYSVHAADITFGANAPPGVGRTVDVQGKLYTSGETEIDGAFNHDGANVGFYGVAPATQQTPTGSRGGNAALASLLAALALTGIIVDGTSA